MRPKLEIAGFHAEESGGIYKGWNACFLTFLGIAGLENVRLCPTHTDDRIGNFMGEENCQDHIVNTLRIPA